MIAVLLVSQSTHPQAGTSAQGMFSGATPQLSVAPPSILKHAHDLLKKHKASINLPPKEPVVETSGSGLQALVLAVQASGSGESSKREEEMEDIEVIVMMVMIMKVTMMVMRMMVKIKGRRNM